MLGDDGCIHAMPHNFNKILKYSPKDDKTELVGHDYGSGGQKWKGCFMGNDGCIYGIPCSHDKILRFDPTTSKSSFARNRYEGAHKWSGCVRSRDGNVFTIPRGSSKVLKVSFVKSHNLANNSALVNALNDKIDAPDLLGFDLYAKVLAEQAMKLQDAEEPLCVGLLAPWGVGKSFTYARKFMITFYID